MGTSAAVEFGLEFLDSAYDQCLDSLTPAMA